MANLAVIPARGGSKRIPRKNIRAFCGRPLMEYPISAAIESALFQRVIVSTDDEEIAAVARAAGAEVPFLRSAETATDFATTAQVLLEVVDCLADPFDSVCCLYPTAPFVTAGILRASHETFLKSGADALMPLVRYGHPIQRSLEIVGDRARYLYPENIGTRTQDLRPRYHDCGQFYWVHWRGLKEQRRFIAGEIAPFIMDETRVHDIDSPEDWSLAEMKFRLLRP
jgi:N-acylneuraminate cytidylyltransferase